MSDEQFFIENIEDREISVLRIKGALEFENRGVFSEYAEKLLESEYPRIVIDLTGLQRIFSVFLGSLVDIHTRAKDKGKKLSVLATPNIIKLLKQVNLDEMLTIVPASGK